MNELLQYVQDLLQYAEGSAANLNPESQQALAELIQQFLEVIEQMGSQGAPPTQPPPPIEPGGPSSNVEGFAYDDRNNRLLVRFLGDHPNRNGPVYAYENVPPVIFNLVKQGAVPARTDGKNKWGKWWKGKVPSLGASVYTLLRVGGFPYKRMS